VTNPSETNRRHVTWMCWSLASNGVTTNQLTGMEWASWTGEGERARALARWQLLDFRPRMRRSKGNGRSDGARELQCSSKQVSKQKRRGEQQQEERHSRFAAIRQAFECVHVPVCTCPCSRYSFSIDSQRRIQHITSAHVSVDLLALTVQLQTLNPRRQPGTRGPSETERASQATSEYPGFSFSALLRPETRRG
jgi:hypothetical protein